MSPSSPMSPSLLSKTKGKYGGTTGRTIRESTGSTSDKHSPEKIPQLTAEQQTVSDLRRMTGITTYNHYVLTHPLTFLQSNTPPNPQKKIRWIFPTCVVI